MEIKGGSLPKIVCFVAITIVEFLAMDVFITLWQHIGKPCRVTHDMYCWTQGVHEREDVYMPLTS
jgi:hypothetical protein